MVELGPQATHGVPHHRPRTEVGEPWGTWRRRWAEGDRGPGAWLGAVETWKWNFGLWGQHVTLQGEKKLIGEIVFGDSQVYRLEG